MRVNCFDLAELPDLAGQKESKASLKERFDSLITEDMPEDQQRQIGKELVLASHKDLFNELNDLKASAGIKLTDEQKAYKAPDNADKIKEISDKYNKLIADKKTEIRKKAKPEGLFKQAGRTSEDLHDPESIAMRYFMGDGNLTGGRIHPSAIEELFGNKGQKSVKGENKAKALLIGTDAKIGNKNKYPTLDELAHSLWESQSDHYKELHPDSSEFKDAIEKVLSDHNTPGDIARELVKRYLEKEAATAFTADEYERINKGLRDALMKHFEDLPAEQIQPLIDLVKKYQDKFGNVDWKSLDDDIGSFSSEYLSLSPEIQNSLDEIISKNISEGPGERAYRPDEDSSSQKEGTGGKDKSTGGDLEKLDRKIPRISGKGNVRETLKHIADHSKEFGPLAKLILDNADKKSLDAAVTIAGRRSMYFGRSNIIKMEAAAAGDPVILLHEIVHATTANKIDKDLKNPSYGNTYGKAYHIKLLSYLKRPDADPHVQQLVKLYLKTADALGYSKKLFTGNKYTQVERHSAFVDQREDGHSSASFSSYDRGPIVQLEKTMIAGGVDPRHTQFYKQTYGGYGLRVWGDKALEQLKKVPGYTETQGLKHEDGKPSAVTHIAITQSYERSSKATAGNADLTVKRGVPYGMGNLDEFLAEGFTAKAFQEKLASIKYDQTDNVWQKFVSAVKGILGIDPKGTVLESLLKTGADIISKGKEQEATPGEQLKLFAPTNEIIDARKKYDKALRELKKAEDSFGATQAKQTGLYDTQPLVMQKEMFNSHDEIKSVLDPLRQKVKEAKDNLDQVQRDVIEKQTGQGSLFAPQDENQDMNHFSIRDPGDQEKEDQAQVIKDEYFDKGITDLKTIQDAIAKDSGEDSPELRRNVKEAFNYYHSRYLPAEIHTGVVERIKQTFGKLLDKGVKVYKNGAELLKAAKQYDDPAKPVRYQITDSQGKVMTVQALPAGTEVVNGFYSPIEKSLRETKVENKSAAAWLSELGKGDEVTFTGLRKFLQDKKPNEQVKKQELLDYIKKNRISIVEVVKGNNNTFKMNDERLAEFNKLLNEDGDRLGFDTMGEARKAIVGDPDWANNWDVTDFPRLVELGNEYREKVGLYHQNAPKYESYQLPGSKKDKYKEVLITMPHSKIDDYNKANKELQSFYDKLGVDTPTKEQRIENDKLLAAQERAKALLPEDTMFQSGRAYAKDSKTFNASHFGEPNILAHLRMSVRPDMEGKKVLLVDEVQSDWGQQGKKKGFVDESKVPAIDKKLKELNDKAVALTKQMYDLGLPTNSSSTEYKSFLNGDTNEVRKLTLKLDQVKNNRDWEAINNRIDEIRANIRRVKDERDNVQYEIKSYQNDKDRIDVANNRLIPAAPFVGDTNSWVKLSLKTALQHAIAEGADKLAWTTGDQQNRRYDLSKQIEKITHSKNGDGNYNIHVVDNNGKDVYDRLNLPESAVEDLVGKDMAKKIVDREGIPDPTNDYSYFRDRGKAVGEVLKNGSWYIKWANGSESGTYISEVDAHKEGQQITRDYVDRPAEDEPKILSGLDLKVGGKGMKGFYGQPDENNLGIVGKVAESLFGKGSVNTTRLDTGASSTYDNVHTYNVVRNTEDIKTFSKQGFTFKAENDATRSYINIDKAEAYKRLESGEAVWATNDTSSLQHSVDITPAMKAEVQRGMPMFQIINKQTEAFYSPLEKFIETSKQGAFTVDQVLGQIKSLPQAEIEAVGLKDFLKGKTKVTKQELLDYVRENKVIVQTVVKGGEKSVADNVARIRELTRQIEERGYTLEADMGGEGDLLMKDDEMVHYDEMAPGIKRLYEEYSQLKFDENGSLRKDVGGTKYGEYTLPGEKSNYREVLLTLPTTKRRLTDAESRERTRLGLKGKLTATEENRYKELNAIELSPKSDFTTGHFDEPNTIAHIRLTDRVTPDGKKILFVEETQSDWAREGRQKGFQVTNGELPKGFELVKITGGEREGKYWVKHTESGGSPNSLEKVNESGTYRSKAFDTKEEAIKNAIKTINEVASPDMPFKNTWQELATKKAIQIAAQEGYDGIAWINGQQTKDRYDLSKAVDHISYVRSGDGTNYELDIKYKDGLSQGVSVSDKKLEDYVGKEVAEKIRNNEGKKSDDYKSHYGLDDYGNPVVTKELSNLDLKVGGEWANNLYDKQIPKLAEKYAKQYGGKVVPKMEIIETKGKTDFGTQTYSQFGIELHPDMKGSTASMPMFMQDPKGEALGFMAPDGSIHINGEKLNGNTPVHEAGHLWLKWAEQFRPDLHDKGMALTENSQYLKDVKANVDYVKQADNAKLTGQAREDFFRNEALSTAIGDQGEQFISKSRKADFKEWLSNLWKGLKEHFGIRDLSAGEISKLTLDEFSKKAAADILSGKELSTEAGQGPKPVADDGTGQVPPDNGSTAPGQGNIDGIGISKQEVYDRYKIRFKKTRMGWSDVVQTALDHLQQDAEDKNTSIRSEANYQVNKMLGEIKKGRLAVSEDRIVIATSHLMNVEESMDHLADMKANTPEDRAALAMQLQMAQNEQIKALAVIDALGSKSGRNLGLFAGVFSKNEDGGLSVARRKIEGMFGVALPETVKELDRIPANKMSGVTKNKIRPYVKRLEEIKKEYEDTIEKLKKNQGDSEEIKQQKRKKASEKVHDLADKIRKSKSLDQLGFGKSKAPPGTQKSGFSVDLQKNLADAVDFIADQIEKIENLDLDKAISDAARKFKGTNDEKDFKGVIKLALGKLPELEKRSDGPVPFDVNQDATDEALEHQRKKTLGQLKELSNRAALANEKWYSQAIDWRRTLIIGGIKTLGRVSVSGITKLVIDPLVKQTTARITSFLPGLGKERASLGATLEGVQSLLQFRNDTEAMKYVRQKLNIFRAASEQLSQSNDKLNKLGEDNNPAAFEAYQLGEHRKIVQQYQKAELENAKAGIYKWIHGSGLSDAGDIFKYGSTPFEQTMGGYTMTDVKDIDGRANKMLYYLSAMSRLHGVEKNPSARRALVETYNYKLENYQKEGIPLDASTRMRALNVAYGESLAGKYQESTQLVDKVNELKHPETLKPKLNLLDKAVSLYFKVALPVAKVGINILKAGVDMSTGGLEGVLRYGYEVNKGIAINKEMGAKYADGYKGLWDKLIDGANNIPEKERMYINKVLGRGLAGIGMMLYAGYAVSNGSIQYGGEYDSDHKAKRKYKGKDGLWHTLDYGQWVLGGQPLGKFWSSVFNHLPEFTPIAMIVNTHNVYQYEREYTGTSGRRQIETKAGAFAAVIASDFNEIVERTPYPSLLKVADLGQSLISLPIAKDISEFFDHDVNGDLIARPPKDFFDRMLENVGARKFVSPLKPTYESTN